VEAFEGNMSKLVTHLGNNFSYEIDINQAEVAYGRLEKLP